MTPPS
jgi:dynein heavy chain